MVTGGHRKVLGVSGVLGGFRRRWFFVVSGGGLGVLGCTGLWGLLGCFRV